MKETKMPEAEVQAGRAQKAKARENLMRATAGMTHQAIALLTLVEVRALIEVTGLSVTFIRNTQRSVTAHVERQELQDVADDIVTRMKGSFRNIAATPNRNRTIKVWLDGLPEEEE